MNGGFLIGGAVGAEPGMGEPTGEPVVDERSFTCSTTRLMTLRVAGVRAAATAAAPAAAATAVRRSPVRLAFFPALRRAGDFA
ncbi:MAG: hypothetical protein ACXW2X_03375, partial [Thermoanaerobaculia bacterium]